MNGRRVLFAFAVSLVLFCFAVQPALTALYTAPGRVVEVIPIDVEEGSGLLSKDAVEGLGLPNVEWNIRVKGVGLVTAAGDAIIQASYIFKEREAGSTEWRTETGGVQVVLPRFVEYREAVEAFKRGEIDQPLPELLHPDRNQDTRKLDDWGEFPTFDWYGFTFVACPGSTKQWVKYNHPDNYYTYYPEQWNLDWTLYKEKDNWGKQVIHHSQAFMGQVIFTCSTWLFALGVAEVCSAADPTHVTTAVIAVLLICGLTFEWWLLNIVLSEQNDGWAYWHYNLVNHNLLISWGAWYEWAWYVRQW